MMIPELTYSYSSYSKLKVLVHYLPLIYKSIKYSPYVIRENLSYCNIRIQYSVLAVRGISTWYCQ